MRMTLGFLCAVTLFSLPFISQAQETSEPAFVAPETAVPAELSSCFDYYRFGSVPVTISPSLSEAAAGATIAFTGNIENENTYPITDASVYVKIFQIDPSGEKSVNGPDLIAFYKAADHLSLAAKEKLPLSFTWDIPEDTASGSYQAATFVVDHSRFNYQGLSFTNDILGNSSNFKVIGSSKGSVRFDTSAFKVGDQEFHAAAYPPKVGTGPVTIAASIANESERGFTGTLTWKLYYWDGLQESHVIDQKTEDIRVAPHTSKEVTFVASDEHHSVYYLVGTLTSASGSVDSIATVRFVRKSVQEPRINSLGITPFPSEGEATAFVCAHSSGTAPAGNTTIDISVRRAGILGLLGSVASNSYTGDVPGSIMALTAPVGSATGAYRVTASLYQSGVLVDTVSSVYCSEKTCKDSTSLLVTGSALIGSLLLVGWLFMRRKRKNAMMSTSVPPATPFPPVA